MKALWTRLAGRRVVLEWLVVGLVTSVVVAWLALGSAIERPSNLVYDALMRLRGGVASDRIVIVAIDNRSIDELGRWPWPRWTHAAMIDRLAAARPRAVAYDVLFTEPSDSGDGVLASSIAGAGNLYLPVFVDSVGDDGAPWKVTEPIAPLRRAAAGLGHANLTVDNDGVVRRIPLVLQAGPHLWPHLVTNLLGSVRRDDPAGGPALDPAAGLTGRDPVHLTYHGPPGQFRTISFVDLLRGETPPQFLTGRLVLVGLTAEGLGDRYATPTSPDGQLTPGVEIQASLLDTLLTDGGVTRPAPWGLAVLSLIPLWCLLAGFLTLRPVMNMMLGVGLVGALLAGTTAAFMAGVWAPPLAAAAGLALAYPLWSWRRLAAASSYMQAEVDAFTGEGFALPQQSWTPSGDVVARQVDTMGAALTRLRDLSRFIADAIRSLPDATLVVDEQGIVTMANDRAAALFGRADLIGAEAPALLQGLAGPDSPTDTDAVAEITTAAGAVLLVDSAPLVNARGGRAGRIVRLADMTAFRTAERQREQALQLLSHDMRTPQVSILTLLESRHDRADPAFERRIADQARLTLGLAESYVQLARAESQALPATVFDIAQAMLDAADTLWPLASAADVTVRTPADPEELLTVGDPSLVSRALMNLIDNAIKYGRPGDVVTCAVAPGVGPTGPTCVCTIEDQGPGLGADALRQLYQPFHRGRTDRPGVGLGLAFVRTVVERHGGDIRHEQAAERGTRVTVTLPRVTDLQGGAD